MRLRRIIQSSKIVRRRSAAIIINFQRFRKRRRFVLFCRRSDFHVAMSHDTNGTNFFFAFAGVRR